MTNESRVRQKRDRAKWREAIAAAQGAYKSGWEYGVDDKDMEAALVAALRVLGHYKERY